MTATDRVGDSLRRALHDLFASRPDLMMLGEDIADPYGGAFGITRGLSTRFPDQIISTPISEAAITGLAGGLALAGDQVIVEIMFGDFIALCFDPIVNFLTKSVSMYGRPVRVPVVLRCPVGGNRGYGPTHSQNLQKHFLGIPHLGLYELSPLHPALSVFERMLGTGEPAIFFEDKVLYTQPRFGGDPADELFRSTRIGGSGDWIKAASDGEHPDWIVLAPGGLVRRVLAAMRTVLIEKEITCELLTPARLYPLDLEPVLPLIRDAGRVLVVEDGVAGGGWASEVATVISERLWGTMRHPVRVLRPPCKVIPAAPHLERLVLVQESTICRALSGDDDD